ncbi:MAG TPA: hypothetical protein VGB83_03750 [Actinomycetota bacterium]
MSQMHCTDCEATIDVAHAGDPCPTCGSIDRSILGSDSGRGREFAISKQGTPPLGEPLTNKWVRREVRAGEPGQRDGTRRELYREIDRDRDLYRERVVNLESGEVERDVEEPLTEHRQRERQSRSKGGSATGSNGE